MDTTVHRLVGGMSLAIASPSRAFIPTPTFASSSAGVFDSTGALVRTLWSADPANPNVSNPAAAWDGTLDNGSVAATGTYTVTLLKQNVQYTWDGVIGNSSPDHTNCNVLAPVGAFAPYSYYYSYGGNINDMAITSGGEMYFTSGYDERMNTVHVSTTANPQYANGVVTQGFRNTYTDSLNCCTDGNIFYIHFWNSGAENSVWGINCSTKLWVVFSAGTGSIGSGNKIGLSSTNQFIFGIAVQQTGNFLYIARQETSTPTYSIWTLNKTTGALVKDNLLGYANQGRIAVNPADDSLWVIHGTTVPDTITQLTANASTGVLTATGVAITGLTNAVALAISPDGLTALVVDGGTSQQVKAFNTSDGSVKAAFGTSGAFGVAGGYANSPAVTNTKFMFSSFAGFSGSIGWIAFVPSDSSFWLGDAGNSRYLHFSSGNSPAYIEQVSYLPGFYSTWVCFNDPTRVFGSYLEFHVDYTKPLSATNVSGADGSWTLVNNWFAGTPGGFQNFSAMRFTIAASNGRTYVPIGGVIYELTSTGYRNTGVSVTYTYIDRSFNLWSWADAAAGSAATFLKNTFTGFDGSQNPTWAFNPASTATWPTVLTTPTLPTGFPTITSAQSSNTTSIAVEPLQNGVMPFYDIGTGNNNHFGGIDSTTGAVKFSTHFPVPSNNGGENTFLTYPQPPYYSHQFAGSGVINPGGFQAYVPGTTDVFTLYRGEDWGSNQTNELSHWHQSGLLVSRVGVAAPYFGHYSSTLQPPLLNAGNLDAVDSLPLGTLDLPLQNSTYGYMGTLGFAGNSSWGGVAQVGGDYYFYNGDEWYHGGVHRWHVSNLSSIQITSQNVAWNSSSFTPPAANPYNFLAALPYNTANLGASVGGWTRSPTPDNTSGNTGTPPWYRAYTSAIICDPHSVPDLVFEANLVTSTATMSYSWTRIGSGNWTISGTLNLFPGALDVESLYVDVLDNTGKKLLRMQNVIRGGGGSFTNVFEVNGTPIRTPMQANVNDIWGNWINQLQPLSIHANVGAGTMTVGYAGYTMTGVTVLDAGADITHPAQFKLTYDTTGGGNRYIGVCFTALQFADS